MKEACSHWFTNIPCRTLHNPHWLIFCFLLLIPLKRKLSAGNTGRSCMASVQKVSRLAYSEFRVHKILKSEFLGLFKQNVQMASVRGMDTKNVTSRQKQVKLEFVSMRPKKQLL
jgi:hypothetical protein